MAITATTTTSPDTNTFFGGTTPSTATAAATGETGLPAWLQEYTRGIMAQGTGIYAQPYQEYTGPRLTSVQDYTQGTQGMNLAQQNVGSWSPAFGQAQSALQTAGQTLPQGIGSYMNPYQDAVVNRIGELGTRNLTEQLLPQVNSTFTGAGQFGSSRNADFTNRALRDVNENILAQQNQALQQGYTSAADQFLRDMTRMGTLAGQQVDYGKALSGMGTTDASTLLNLANIQKTEDQQSYDLGYNQFLEQRDYPKTQLEFMNSLVRGVPYTQSAFTTQTNLPGAAPTNPSPLSAIGAGLSSGASLSALLGG